MIRVGICLRCSGIPLRGTQNTLREKFRYAGTSLRGYGRFSRYGCGVPHGGTKRAFGEFRLSGFSLPIRGSEAIKCS